MEDKLTKYTSQNAMKYVLQVIPEYKKDWEEHLDYWKDEKRTVGLDLYSFLDFTVKQIEKNNTEILPKIFNIIEKLNVYGDESVQDAASMKFLEGLTNTSGNAPERVPYESYINLLGPESKDFCRRLDKLWRSPTPGLWTEEEIKKEFPPVETPIKYTKLNTIDYILQVIPEYKDCWIKHLEYWKDEERTIGIDLTSFLNFTKKQIEKNNTEILPKIFNIIEELNVYGDESVQDAASMTFLEGLTNTSGNAPERIPYESYINLLGPESKDFCRHLDKFWGSPTPGLWTEEEIKKEFPPVETAIKDKIEPAKRCKCPVCGHLSFYEYLFPGSEYFCQKCNWMDDKEQYENPDLVKEVNGMSLNQAKNLFKEKIVNKKTTN